MSLAQRISAYNRERKWRLFQKIANPSPETRVLDAGFSDEEYGESDNYLEKRYPYPQSLTALSIDTAKKFLQRYPEVTAVTYDGDRFPFGDKSFDACWSNAVLEHVGERERQVAFLREIRRVARVGFVTTPNRWFPVEIHTRIPLLHYLPRRAFGRCAKLLGKGWAAGGYMRLLSMREIRGLLADARITDYTIHRNRLCGPTLDFVIVFGAG